MEIPQGVSSLPEVSVIVPAHNAERTLESTLHSILVQTFTDYEVLVVDDGSTDGTARIAADTGAPVVCLRQQHGGVSTARNHGLAHAKGRYVAFLDADDLWEPEKLQRQLALMTAHPEIGACFTGYLRVDDAVNVIGRAHARDYTDFCAALLLGSMVVQLTSTALLRKSVTDDVAGFDPAFSQCADWDYALRLSTRTRFAQLDVPLARYRQSSTSMSSNIALLESDTFAVLNKFFSTDSAGPYRYLRRRCYSNQWMILSGSYLHAGLPHHAVRCMLRGVRLHPSNVRRPLSLPLRWTRRHSLRTVGR
jgi:glycosyltransferase involved in cell wall biosynthesis